MSAVQEAVREILERVRKEGEAAVRYYSEKFDNWSPESFRISQDEIQTAKRSFRHMKLKTLTSARNRSATLPRNK